MVGSPEDIQLLARARSSAPSTLTTAAMTDATPPTSKLSTVTMNSLFTTFPMSPGATVVTVLSEGQQLSKYIFSVYNNSNFSPDMWLVGWQNASGLQEIY